MLMLKEYIPILQNPTVCEVLKQAWRDSNPGISGGHEEGGFIVQDAERKWSVIRWPKGEQNCILLPSHHNCKIGEHDIVASFHTHSQYRT